MNDNINIFERALYRFAFKEPLPEHIQQAIQSYKKESLVQTLKELGEYNIAYGLILKIYYLTKRLGISISVAQSKMIFGIISFLIGIVLTIVLSIAIKNIGITENTVIDNTKKNEFMKEESKTYKQIINKKSQIDKKKNKNTKFRIGIEEFTGDLIDKSILKKITDNLAYKFIQIKGKNRIIDLRSNRGQSHINLLLRGSIEKLGETYIITAKIIDIESSRILFITTEEAESIDSIKDACSMIAERAAESLK